MIAEPTFAIVGVAMCASVAICIKSIADATVKHAQVRRGSPSDREVVSDARLARLEVAVESIAVEIERISEGQRFTTRLLNDQAQRGIPRLDRPGQIDTPH